MCLYTSIQISLPSRTQEENDQRNIKVQVSLVKPLIGSQVIQSCPAEYFNFQLFQEQVTGLTTTQRLLANAR